MSTDSPAPSKGRPAFAPLPDGEARRRTLESGVANGDCDAEPIHIPGGIQPHGYLLAVSDDLRILQASDNLATLTAQPVETLLGQPVEALLGRATADRLAHAAATAQLDEAPLYLGIVENMLHDMNAHAPHSRPATRRDSEGAEFDV